MLLSHPEGVNLPYMIKVFKKSKLYKTLNLSDQALYKRFYRILNKLIKMNLVEKVGKKHSKYIIYKPKFNSAEDVINLISFPFCFSNLKSDGDNNNSNNIININSNNNILTIIRRNGIRRDRRFIEAVLAADEFELIRLGAELKDIAKLKALKVVCSKELLETELERVEIIKNFLDYVWDISQRYIVLQNEERYLIVPYNSRFLKKKTKERIEFLKTLWEETARKYHFALFITLTLDPKKLEGMNLVEKRYFAFEQLNRFKTWLFKYLSKRDEKYKIKRKREYICFVEYHRNGQIHFHLVIFGVRYIDHEVLAEKWGLGFVYINRLVRNRGSWKMICKENKLSYFDPFTYFSVPIIPTPNEDELLDYIICLSDIETESGRRDKDDFELEGGIGDKEDIFQLAMHWCLNTRFYTLSKSLQKHINNIIKLKNRGKKIIKYRWKFVAVISKNKLKLFNHNDVIIKVDY